MREPQISRFQGSREGLKCNCRVAAVSALTGRLNVACTYLPRRRQVARRKLGLYVGESRRESHDPVAIGRLSELIPEIDSGFAAVGEFVNACQAGEHSDLSWLEAFDAEFQAQQLYDRVALAKGYFEQLGIGPDADVLLNEVTKLRDDVLDYGEKLVRLADASKGDAAAEADVLQASSGLHDRALVLHCDLLAVEAAHETVKDLYCTDSRVHPSSRMASGRRSM